MKTNIHFLAEKIKTHILCSITLFRKSCRLRDDVEKYCKAGQATRGNMAHAHYTPDNYGYKHSEYVILIASPWQLWLHKGAAMLRFT